MKNLIHKNVQSLGLESLIYSTKKIETKIDLALLSGQKILLPITPQEYIEVSAALGIIFDDPRVLLIGKKGLEQYSLDGFDTIYQKLEEKLSYVMHNNLKNVQLILFEKQTINFNYSVLVGHILSMIWGIKCVLV